MLEKSEKLFPNFIYEKWDDRKTVVNLLTKLEEAKKEAIEFGIVYRGRRINREVLKRACEREGIVSFVDADLRPSYLTVKSFEDAKNALEENIRYHECYFLAVAQWLSTVRRLDVEEKLYYGYSNDEIRKHYDAWRGEDE